MMDSDNSAMTAIRSEEEVLTAAEWESTTPANLQQTYKRVLIDNIKLMNGRSFTTCDLHASMMTKVFVNNTRFCWE